MKTKIKPQKTRKLENEKLRGTGVAGTKVQNFISAGLTSQNLYVLCG